MSAEFLETMSAEFLETMSDKSRFALAEDLYEAMMGGNSIGHTSLVVSVCKEHNVPALDWNEALEFCQEMGFEIAESPCCGWVSEGNFDEIAECPCCGWVSEGNYYEHPDHEEGVCDNCEEE